MMKLDQLYDKKIITKDIKLINSNNSFLVYVQENDPNGKKVIREKLGERSIHWVESYQI